MKNSLTRAMKKRKRLKNNNNLMKITIKRKKMGRKMNKNSKMRLNQLLHLHQ
jgi:hypothetical protein